MMPELPEVETIKRELKKRISGKVIRGARIKNSKVIKTPSPAKFKKEAVGEKIEEIIRCGKLLVLKLKKDKFLIIHLRITGWLKYGRQEEKAKVIFRFPGDKFLNYMDSRLLGHLSLRKDYKNLDFVKRLGPEISQLRRSSFQKMAAGRGANIKALIMNQRFIAGVGNIYAQESLFLAGIDPRRKANSLSREESGRLYDQLKSVLAEAIKYRGSSVDSYRNLAGRAGGMEKRLKVYGRSKKPCFACGAPLKKIAVGGRGTCFCPRCQS